MKRRVDIPQTVQNEVRARANSLCEYCHASERWQYVAFTVDHVTPISRGGTDEMGNLALACFACNRRKSNYATGFDPVTSTEVPLFNPRLDAWNDHFMWSAEGLIVIGLTPVGRATIERLQFNRERSIYVRAADVEVGRHPPANDRKFLQSR